MVNETLACIRTNDETWHTQSIAILIDCRGSYMIIETSPIISGKKYGCAIPVWALHDGIDDVGDIRLPYADFGWWMLTDIVIWDDPGDSWQCAIFCLFIKMVNSLNIFQLIVLL